MSYGKIRTNADYPIGCYVRFSNKGEDLVHFNEAITGARHDVTGCICKKGLVSIEKLLI